jgi:DNA-binding transcriptional ArsR family regulator
MSNHRIEEIRKFAEMFKALSNPNRLDIFLRLVSCCPPGTTCSSDAEARRFVGELGKELDITLSTVSHHIKELRHAGLIRVERRGKNIECWVDEQAVRAITELLAGRESAGCFPEEGKSARLSVGEIRPPQV